MTCTRSTPAHTKGTELGSRKLRSLIKLQEVLSIVLISKGEVLEEEAPKIIRFVSNK